MGSNESELGANLANNDKALLEKLVSGGVAALTGTFLGWLANCNSDFCWANRAKLFLLFASFLARLLLAKVNHDVSVTAMHFNNSRLGLTMKQNVRKTCALSFVCLEERQP